MLRQTAVLSFVFLAVMAADPSTDQARGVGNKGNRVLLNLELGKSSFEEVTAILGKTRYFQYEDADAICYRSKTPDHVFVLFASGVAGEHTYLTDFTISASSIRNVDSGKCAPSEQIARHLATLSGLRLGLSVKEIENILGKPSERHGNTLIYESVEPVKMTDDERRYFQKTFPQSGSFDMLAMTRIKFVLINTRVVSLQVLYTVTT
jgi:hypothetical protein